MKKAMNRDYKGLTLMEVLVVVAIISIMVSIGYFSLIRGVRSERIKGAIFQLKSDILQQRELAMAKGEYVGITVDSLDNTQYLVVKLDSFPNFKTVLKHISLPSGVRFGHSGSGDINGGGIDGTVLPSDGVWAVGVSNDASMNVENWVMFGPNGTLAFADVYYLYLTNGERTYGLRVNKWGLVRVYRYSGGGWHEIH